MVAFIDEHRGVRGRADLRRAADRPVDLLHAGSPERTRNSDRRVPSGTKTLRPEIQRVWDKNLAVYGADKVWRQLRREGFRRRALHRRTTHESHGPSRAVRGRAFTTTTVADEASARPLDLVQREFQATRPNQLWVADITYVATWAGFVYVAFVIDVFSRAIVG